MSTMNSQQIFMILAVVGALSASMIAIPVMAQNVTGGNMTGGNMTGKISGGFDFQGQQMAKCIPPEVKVDPFTCGIPRGSGGGSPFQFNSQEGQNAHLLKLKFQRVNVGSINHVKAMEVQIVRQRQRLMTMMVEIPTVVMVEAKTKAKTTKNKKRATSPNFFRLPVPLC